MNFKPNPLLYGANEDFFSSFKLVITMRFPVNHEALSRSVAGAMERYPYFSVSPEKVGESLLLQFNERPVPVFFDGRCAVLGTAETNGHLLAFGCEGNRILLHASHYIADGMGIVPLLKTVLYLYVSEMYGTEGLQPAGILMPGEAVAPAEYEYPFPDAPVEIDDSYQPKKAQENAYMLHSDAFDQKGLYAYHLHIPQKAMMAKANPSDGSPVSFLSVMMYRAICELDGDVALPVVAHVQHQYRSALRAPLSRHSLVSYIPVALPPRVRWRSVECQNTILRGQIILGSEKAADLMAVNRLLEALPSDENATLAEKEHSMQQYIESTIQGKTFGISYVGKMDWSGLDQYVVDMHAYIGEKHTPAMLLMEVMTIGDDFTINFMQHGRGTRYVDAFARQLRNLDIPVQIVGEERYTLCDTKISDRNES